MSNFKEGDVVKLKSGSPLMTVSLIRPDSTVVVSWYDSESSTIKTDVLRPSVLKVA